MARVLVVDDSSIDRVLAGRLLTSDQSIEVNYAADGHEALEKLARSEHDLVLTDLQMPGMDGLQLVQQVRREFPLVPVVLMTAHGSEDVAVKALMSGATSYVPKVELPRHLLDTVLSVLSFAQSNKLQQRLFEFLDMRELKFSLENDPALIPPLVDQFQQIMAALGLVEDASRVQAAIALEEALFNALYHGNLELHGEELESYRASLLMPGEPSPVQQRLASPPFCDRRLQVVARFTREQAMFAIRDQGPGFDRETAPDPSDPATLARASGRGLVLMNMFMDEVRYNDEGNEVVLIKRRSAAEPGSDAEPSGADEN